MWKLKRKKKNSNEVIYKAEINLQTEKTNLWLPKGERERRVKLGVWINRYTLTICKIDKQGPLCSTGSCTQYFVITYKGKESENDLIYINESLCHTPETNTGLYISCTSIK